VEGLDLPAHGIPVQLFNRFVAGPDGKVSDQLPVDSVRSFRGVAFGTPCLIP
jgi:hypothetical protein